jgi:hypothetical protein
MKKTLLALAFLGRICYAEAQGPGLVISEIFVNPSGTDSPFEWVELVATTNIDFSVTPYTVITANNGNATASGWINGGTLTYAFEITTGTVAAGNVVYVGGTSMIPTGPRLREINTATTGGDGGIGSLGSGPFGNGGAHADGIAVFNLPVASITAATAPVEAIFYGIGTGATPPTTPGNAVVNAGVDGYQLPNNDVYAGGKLQTTSYFIAFEPGVGYKASGYFNTTSHAWSTPRSWVPTDAAATATAALAMTTAIQLVTADPLPQVSVTGTVQTVNESAGTINVPVAITLANASPVKVVFSLSTWTDAVNGSDFEWTGNDTLTVPANTNGTFNFPIDILDDTDAERAEKLIVKATSFVNGQIAGNDYQIIFITDNDYQAPVATNELQMNLLTSFSNGASGANSAEIVAYDSSNYRLYIANSIGAKLDIVDFANPAAPVLLSSIPVTTYGNINSVAVHNGVVALAIENVAPQQNGYVVFLDANGVFLSQVDAGAMPDMITFSHDFTKVLVANEGEPRTDYSLDPEGSITIIDLTPGAANLTNANATQVLFTEFNGQEAAMRAQGIRIFGPGSTAAQDFEPEYIALNEDDTKAYVSLQENNAMAVIDIATGTVDTIRPLGLSDYMSGNGMDASDQSGSVLITSLPVKGAYMPDAISYASIGGTGYVFSANEGDAREYTAVTDVARVSATSLDATAFPDQNILKNNSLLGRLNVLQATGDTDNDGDKDELQVLGSRSFSIWNAATGALVFDSKDLIEQIISHDAVYDSLFNMSNTVAATAKKNRSDDKGPEPEGVTTAFIAGSHYVFVSMERVGGVMAFNVDQPQTPVFAGYYNNRTAAHNGPDLGAEGIIYIPADQSPNGNKLVILANEVSSTLSVYQVQTCAELANATITASADVFCAGGSADLGIAGDADNEVQWLKDGAAITGETSNMLTVTEAGSYRVYISNETLACADTSVAYTIAVNALPIVVAQADDTTLCPAQTLTLTGAGAISYSWNNDVVDGESFTPIATATYEVTGTDANGCENTDTIHVSVNPLPTVVAHVNDAVICAGDVVIFTGSGADTYAWDNGIVDGANFTPAQTGSFSVTGTDLNGCSNTNQVSVIVNALPTVNLGADTTVCANQLPITLNAGSGQTAYLWTGGATTQTLTVTTAGTYTATVTNANGCMKSDAIVVTVNPCLGLEEATWVAEIFPNPATDQVQINFGTAVNAVNLELIDAQGKTVYTQRNFSGTATTIQLNGLNSGLYFLQIEQAGSVSQYKVVKQ